MTHDWLNDFITSSGQCCIENQTQWSAISHIVLHIHNDSIKESSNEGR